MSSLFYPSDLTNAQWKRIESMLPKAKPGGRPRTTDLRGSVNAIMYMIRSGCPWRMLPRDFPPWGTVHYYYRRWRRGGVWKRIYDRLREEVRRQAGRQATPASGARIGEGPKKSRDREAGARGQG